MKQKFVSLVTGGAGFIGSHVADELVRMGQRVIILDDLSGGFVENINNSCTLVKGSVNDVVKLEQLFNLYRFDYVFHLAAYAAEGLSHFIRRYNYENNLIGSINLINLAVKFKVKHFVFTSSIAVYGSNQTPMVEELTPRPEDPYGIAKYAVELDLKAAHSIFDLTYTIFRPHNVYGERQNYGDPYRNVLGIFINNVLQGKPMPIFGDGKQTRAFSYIGDVAPVIARSIEVREARSQIFNIGADTPYTVLEIAEAVAKAMGVARNIIFLPARNEVRNAYSSHEKVKRIFNIKKTTSLEKGIDKMVFWAKELGPRKTKKFKNIEITENMPQGWKKLMRGVKTREDIS